MKVGDIVKFKGPDHSLSPADRVAWGLVIDHNPRKMYEKWTIQWNAESYGRTVWQMSDRHLEVLFSAEEVKDDFKGGD